MAELFRKAQAGELVPFARVISESDEPSSMQIGKIKVSNNGVERVVTDQMFTIATNGVDGDRTSRSAAAIFFPVDGSDGRISVSGNASVSNTGPMLPLKLSGNVKRLRAKSPSGGFAVASVGMQHDSQTQYFDLLFGTKGQPEVVDENGRKDRPHITLFPDGNGKFLRLDSSESELSFEQAYLHARGLVVPQLLRVKSPRFQEDLVLEFAVENEAIVLASVKFVANGP